MKTEYVSIDIVQYLCTKKGIWTLQHPTYICMYTNRAKNNNFLFMHIYQYVELISPRAGVRTRREIERKLAYLNRCKNIFLKYFQDGKLPRLTVALSDVFSTPVQYNRQTCHYSISNKRHWLQKKVLTLFFKLVMHL